MIFRDEKDLRTFVRKAGGDRVFWIEPRSGGTVGFPDCLVGIEGVAAFVELKCGPVDYDRFDVPAWRNDLRPVQKMTLGRMTRQGLKCFVLVARQGTTEIGFIDVLQGISTPRGSPLAWTRAEGWAEVIDIVTRKGV